MKSKLKSRIPWREKLEKPQQPKLVMIPPKMARFGTGTMLIPTPKLVDDLLRRIPKGSWSRLVKSAKGSLPISRPM